METMKKLVITGEKTTEIIDAPKPEPFENWVLVKVHVFPLCTEYKGWCAGHGYPGHEAAGEVVAVAKPCKVEVGDRVAVMAFEPCGDCDACRKGYYIHCEAGSPHTKYSDQPYDTDTHVQYLLKQDWQLPKIPDNASYEMGSLACCGLGPTMGALDKMDVNSFDTVLITGLGPVGLGGVVNAKFRGAKVIGVDSVKYRQDKALELGADLVLDPDDPKILEKIAEFGKPNAAMECSGDVPAQRLCINATARLGKIAIIGEGGDFPVHASNDLIRTGKTIFGQWHYNLNIIPKVMQVIAESPVVEKLITHTFPMSKVDEALALDAEHVTGKIMIKPFE